MVQLHPISDRAYAEAAAWLGRLCADCRDSADEDGFRAWLAASAENAAAFEAVDRTWDVLGALPGFEDAIPARQESRISRRLLLASVGLATIGATGFYVLRPASAHTFETGVGEQKRVTLEDGSRLFLDAQTKVSLSFSDKLRSALMPYGRTNFQIAFDANRPFIVEAAQRKIVADHCNLDIRCDGEQVQVVLIHGEADVQPKTADTPMTRLQPGERMIATPQIERFDRPRLAPLVAWQDGYEIFESTRLEEAVAEMNRYSDTKIAVDPRVADRKVSGVYRTGDNIAFARVVAQLLSVGVRQDDQAVSLVPLENN
ncbi:MAG TPA: FecR domain-containing protein [Rhizomicrobium sp.]|nr:FecR domain-containing protein [Rhizomicrobium sp.]